MKNQNKVIKNLIQKDYISILDNVKLYYETIETIENETKWIYCYNCYLRDNGDIDNFTLNDYKEMTKREMVENSDCEINSVYDLCDDTIEILLNDLTYSYNHNLIGTPYSYY